MSISNPNSLYETLQLCSLHCAVIKVTFHNSSVTPKRIRTIIYWSFLDIALEEPRAGVDFFRVIYLKWIKIISKKPHWYTIKLFFCKETLGSNLKRFLQTGQTAVNLTFWPKQEEKENKSDEKIVKQFTEVWRSNSTAVKSVQYNL